MDIRCWCRVAVQSQIIPKTSHIFLEWEVVGSIGGFDDNSKWVHIEMNNLLVLVSCCNGKRVHIKRFVFSLFFIVLNEMVFYIPNNQVLFFMFFGKYIYIIKQRS